MFEATFDALRPRPCFAVSKRGNGKSDKPAAGYGLDDQASDLLGALEELAPDSGAVLAYSAAVPSAILAAVQKPTLFAGLILCDYPAAYPAIPQTWADSIIGREDYEPEECPPHVLQAVVDESERRDLSDSLRLISCPVLVLHGLGEGTYLKQDALQAYMTRVRDVRGVGIEGAGHAFIMTHFEAFAEAVRAFLDEIDP